MSIHKRGIYKVTRPNMELLKSNELLAVGLLTYTKTISIVFDFPDYLYFVTKKKQKDKGNRVEQRNKKKLEHN